MGNPSLRAQQVRPSRMSLPPASPRRYHGLPRRDLKWALIATTAFAVINFCTYFAENRNSGGRDPAGRMLINEFTGAYTFLLVLPAIYWLIHRWPLRRATWTKVIPLYIVANVALGGMHTTLMTLTRKVAYPAFGYEPYLVTHVFYRYFMEFTKQVVLFWIVVAIYNVAEKLRLAQAQQLALVKMEKQLTDARLASLQMQLSPHFLFNTLNMISSIMYEQVEVADRMIGHLSDLLRGALSSSDRLQITLAEELAQLEHYLAILQARFGDRIIIQQRIEESALTCLMPPLVLQPLVENSVKHGMGKTVLTISIEAAIRDGLLELAVRDDGLCQKPPVHQGTGMRSIQERLQTLHANDAKLSTRVIEPRGLSVQLLIPVRLGGPQILTAK